MTIFPYVVAFITVQLRKIAIGDGTTNVLQGFLDKLDCFNKKAFP